MRIAYYVASTFVILGWLVSCVSIGFAVAGVAGTVAGVIAGILTLFFTTAILFLEVYSKSSNGCGLFGVGALWLIASVWSGAVLLGGVMTSGWALLFAVLIAVAWLISLVVGSTANKYM